MKGTLRLAPQPVDLVAVAQAAVEAARPCAATKHVHLAFTGSPGHRTVSGDAGRLQQVIANLLTNAIKFTPAGGRVDVFIESSNDQMEVRVVDTGQGIGPDFLPHVFERFRQADDATTRRHTGLGLGLAIVRASTMRRCARARDSQPWRASSCPCCRLHPMVPSTPSGHGSCGHSCSSSRVALVAGILSTRFTSSVAAIVGRGTFRAVTAEALGAMAVLMAATLTLR